MPTPGGKGRIEPEKDIAPVKLTRTLLPAALVGALLFSGCSAGGSTISKDASGEKCLTGGEASKSIKTKGETGVDLEITSKTPVKAKKLQRTVLKEGKGEPLDSGESLSAAMTLFNGSTGEALQQVPASPITIDEDALSEWAYDGVRCAVPGQQVAMVAPYDELFPSTDPEDLGIDITTDDSVVVVMDFEKSDLLDRAEGEKQEVKEGLPTVKLADDGAPTITIPEGEDAPKELETATLIKGEGDKVEAGDSVTVNYTGVIWRTGEVFDSSWESGSPASFTTDGVIEGFSKALVGQTVGSQVMSIVPAEDGGYGADQLKEMGYEADDTMVFVLDILSVTHATATEDSESDDSED